MATDPMSVPFNARKRQRDPQDEVENLEWLAEAEHKKRRSSLTTGSTSLLKSGYVPASFSTTSTLTPADSDDEGAPSFRPTSHRPSFTSIQTRSLAIPPSPHDERSYSPDLDMPDLSPIYTRHFTSTTLLSPLKRSSLVEERLPTPMFGSFPTSSSSTRQTKRDTSEHSENDDPSLSSETSEVVHRRQVQHRRLPSPISERDDPLSPMDTSEAGEMMGRLEVRNRTNGSHSRRSDSAMDFERSQSDDRDTSRESERGRARYRPDVEKRTKPVLTMGFRADCEKCRARVPGHYSHVLPASL
ncbi:MAG: hypothetical protein M4579_003503 [Chaenotheca gracillima]|nr:MAG: hypothetical protein M4579_003503 [Chaenotheca gracillima]